MMGAPFDFLKVASYVGDQIEAKRLCQEVKAVHEELGDLGGAIVALSNAGHVCIELGKYDAAARHLQEALQQSAALRQGRFVMNVLHGLADLASRVGRYRLAYELATFVCCTPMTFPGMVEDAQRLRSELEAKLPLEVTAAAEARAKVWTLDDAVAEALAV